MSRYVKISDSEYKLSVSPNGTITLDTGPQNGTVIITGNLLVQGDVTTTETTELRIEDRVITLNFGDNTGSIVGNSQSGIEIFRGNTNNQAFFLFDDRDGFKDFNFKVGPSLTGIKTNSVTTNGESILFLRNTPSTATLSVSEAVDYEKRILNYDINNDLIDLAYRDDDDIPNMKVVADYTTKFFELTPPFKIQDSVFDEINGVTILYDSILEIHDSQADGGSSNLELILDGASNAVWYSDKHEVQNIRIFDNVIQPISSNTDLILRSPGSGTVTVDDTLALTQVATEPSFASNEIRIYSKNESQGGTGLYFVNIENTRDEIASRRKALVYSMIF
jgi:hypothetical protein